MAWVKPLHSAIKFWVFIRRACLKFKNEICVFELVDKLIPFYLLLYEKSTNFLLRVVIPDLYSIDLLFQADLERSLGIKNILRRGNLEKLLPWMSSQIVVAAVVASFDMLEIGKCEGNLIFDVHIILMIIGN